jgi:hypothetical protein
MKCIGAAQGLFVWIIIGLIVWLFVPESMKSVHNNVGWVSGLAIFGWWIAGYVVHCTKH